MGTAEFDDAVRVLLSEHGMSTAQLVTLMSNPVAARLGTAEFDDAVKILCNEHRMNAEQLGTLMSDSVAKRLGTLSKYSVSKSREIL